MTICINFQRLVKKQEIAMNSEEKDMNNTQNACEPVVDIICGQRFVRKETVCCPLCGQINPSRFIKAQFGMNVMVAECSDCRLAYQTPQPSMEACQAYMNMRWSSGDSYVSDTNEQVRRAQSQMRYVNRLCPQKGSLLDIGAGIGTFVRVAIDDGWKATGVERSTTAQKRALAENNVELLTKFPEAEYDIITLWDVVEHLQQPFEMFTSVKKLLRPNGYVIMETVNWESWLRLAMGDQWNLYLLDHHFYFSPPSLEKVLMKCGLCNFRILNTGPTPPIFRMFFHIGLNNTIWKGYRQAKKLWPEHYAYNVMFAAAQKPG
jgi:2-polyprenyl-3-methyl-5-hydroxy-6-metoxy-1,4-benzoquinol methylase